MAVEIVNPRLLEESFPSRCGDVYCDSTQTDMALTEDDVKRLIRANRPSLWDRVKESLPLLVVVSGGTFILHTYLPNVITSQTSSMAADVSSLKTEIASVKTGIGEAKKDIGEIRNDIKNSLNKALDRAYQGISPGPPKIGARRSLDLGITAMQMANDFRINLDAPINNRLAYGQSRQLRFIQNCRGAAWNATQLCLTQRTLQSDVRSIVEQDAWLDATEFAKTSFPILRRLFQGISAYVTKRLVPHDRCAMMDEISGWSSIKGFDTCPAYLRLVGNEKNASPPPLDGHHFRNIVFQDLRIRYNNGALTLENVIFINCSFELAPGASAIKLARVIFQDKEVKFSKAS